MSKKQIRIFLTLVCWMFCVVCFGNTAKAETDGWKDGYYYINGEKQTSKWIVDKGNRYYLNKSGRKLIGWHRIGKYYYFFNAKGNNYKYGKDLGVKIIRLSSNVVTMGVDASQYQGNVDWNKVKKSGVNFVMLRLGYGAGRFGTRQCQVDPRFKEYVKELKKLNIPIGIYFYSYAITPKQALEEAEFVIKQLDGIPVAFPVAYDVEDNYIISHTNTAQRTANIKTFLDTVAAAGYHPMYYSNWNWYTNYLNPSELENYDFWYARYTHEEPDQKSMPHTMWQATSTQVQPGITQNTVDIDFLYKDYRETLKVRSSALKYGWYTDGLHRYYYYRGKRKTNGWMTLAGHTYYLTKQGTAMGWREIDDETYYFNAKGEMKTGIVKIKGKRYLFSEDGAQQFETKEKGITIDEDGVCHIKKGWYKDDNGKFLYRNSDGSLAKSKWITTDGVTYYVGKEKRRVYGLKTIGGNRYYFDKNKKGAMKTGWLTYKGSKYYFKKNGQMVVGKTIKIKGKKYTFLPDGKLK
ncbi:MAG: GH25 family lysozyme [Eubacteriales bacterium]|nr:GH25 family lysozyme [Eubacteriales bacterium]